MKVKFQQILSMKYLISQSVKIKDNGTKFNYLDEGYTRYFNHIGIKLIPVDNLENEISDYLNNDIHGVILSGSGDIKKIVNSGISERKPVFSHERDITENKLTPTYRILSDEEKQKIMEKYHVGDEKNFPNVLINDPLAVYYGVKLNELVEVTYPSKTNGITYFYRLCVTGI